MHTALTTKCARPEHRQQLRSPTPGSNAKYECWQYNRLHPITPRWFHVLLNSLFKVLCNFPSRYLFAIGLVLIFSFRCGIPPTLSCTSKQLDSKTRPITTTKARTGLTPSMESCFPANFRQSPQQKDTPKRNTASSYDDSDASALSSSAFTRRY